MSGHCDEIRAWSLIATPLIIYIFEDLLKVKSKFLFLHSKEPDFRRMGNFFQMRSPKHTLEKSVMTKKGVKIRALDGTLVNLHCK